MSRHVFTLGPQCALCHKARIDDEAQTPCERAPVAIDAQSHTPERRDYVPLGARPLVDGKRA